MHTEAQGLCGNHPLLNHSSSLFVEVWSIHGTQSLPRWLVLLASVLRGIPFPPSEAGLSGGPKHTTSVYEFTWVVGSRLWQELFPPGCLPSPSRVICSCLSGHSFSPQLRPLPFFMYPLTPLMPPKTLSAKKPWVDFNFLGPFSSFSCLLLSKLRQK